MESPAVTVVLPTDNSGLYRKTLEHLQMQEYEDYECLLLYRDNQDPPCLPPFGRRIRAIPCSDTYRDAIAQSRAPFLVFLRGGDAPFPAFLGELMHRASQAETALLLFGAWHKTEIGYSQDALPYDGALPREVWEERLIGALCGRRKRRYPSLAGCEDQILFRTQTLRDALALCPADRAFPLRTALVSLLRGERVLCVWDCLTVQNRPARPISSADRRRILAECRAAVQKNEREQAQSLFANLAKPAIV